MTVVVKKVDTLSYNEDGYTVLNVAFGGTYVGMLDAQAFGKVLEETMHVEEIDGAIILVPFGKRIKTFELEDKESDF